MKRCKVCSLEKPLEDFTVDNRIVGGRSSKCRACQSLARDPTRSTWLAMQQRCYVKTSPSFSRYGGRGITVCDRWMTFANFLDDMGPRPDGCSLDRIDGTKPYEPGNCRWATEIEQQNNRRDNVILSIDGETMTMAEAARKFDIEYCTLQARIHRGMSPEDAVREGKMYAGSPPFTFVIAGETLTMRQITAKYGISSSGFRKRIKRMSPDEAVSVPLFDRSHITGEDAK